MVILERTFQKNSMLPQNGRIMKIKKRTISDDISRYLRDQIMTGKYETGHRIVESQVARDLGVSQAPVREALLQLEGMGLVESKPYVGCYVLPVNTGVIKQAYELRDMLEAYAATLAIDKMQEDEIGEMEQHLQNMRKALAENDRQTIIDEDNNLHSVLIKKVGNPLLLKMWEMSSVQWANLTISYYDDLEYIVESHVKIIEYLKAKDLDSLKQELDKHFDTACKITMHSFEKLLSE